AVVSPSQVDLQIEHHGVPQSNVSRERLHQQLIQEHVQRTIVEKLSESLKVNSAAIEVDEPFADYGVDSITGVQLIQSINAALGLELSVTIVFDYSSVNELTAYILSHYKETVTAVLAVILPEYTEQPLSVQNEKGAESENPLKPPARRKKPL